MDHSSLKEYMPMALSPLNYVLVSVNVSTFDEYSHTVDVIAPGPCCNDPFLEGGVFSPNINGFPLPEFSLTLAELKFAMEGKSVIHGSSLVIRQVNLDVLLDVFRS